MKRKLSAPKSPKKESRIDLPEDEIEQVPTAQAISELSEVTLEACTSLNHFAEQLERGQIRGPVFEHPDTLPSRESAINWLVGQFEHFGFRDEWLSVAISFVDRTAASILHKSCATNTSSSSSLHTPERKAGQQFADDALKKVCEVVQHKEVWLAAVQMSLKMCEAESELDSSIQDLVLPLASFGIPGLKCDSHRWEVVLKAEFFLMNNLSFSIMVPSPFQFVERLAMLLARAARSEALKWDGFEEFNLPRLKGPPLKNREQLEKRYRMMLPGRPMTLFQAVAHLLIELAIAHRPADVYTENLSLAAVATIVLELALHAFEGSAPKVCAEMLAEHQMRMLAVEQSIARQRLLTSLHELWFQPPVDSAVFSKWNDRASDVGLSIPKAPPELPLELKAWNSFSTPQRKQLLIEPRSGTPPKSAQRHSFADPLLEDCSHRELPACMAVEDDKLLCLEPEAKTVQPGSSIQDTGSSTNNTSPSVADTQVTTRLRSQCQRRGSRASALQPFRPRQQTATATARLVPEPSGMLTYNLRTRCKRQASRGPAMKPFSSNHKGSLATVTQRQPEMLHCSTAASHSQPRSKREVSQGPAVNAFRSSKRKAVALQSEKVAAESLGNQLTGHCIQTENQVLDLPSEQTAVADLTNVEVEQEMLTDSPDLGCEQDVFGDSPDLGSEKKVFGDSPELGCEQEVFGDSPDLGREEDVFGDSPNFGCKSSESDYTEPLLGHSILLDKFAPGGQQAENEHARVALSGVQLVSRQLAPLPNRVPAQTAPPRTMNFTTAEAAYDLVELMRATSARQQTINLGLPAQAKRIGHPSFLQAELNPSGRGRSQTARPKLNWKQMHQLSHSMTTRSKSRSTSATRQQT